MYNNEKYPSRLYFLLQLVFIIVIVFICFLKYKTLPHKLSINFNLNSELSAIINKSELIKISLPLVIVQLVILVIFYLFFELTIRGKIKLSVPLKGDSYELNYNMRKIMTCSFILLSWMGQIFLSIILLYTFKVIKLNKVMFLLLVFFFAFIIFGSMIYFIIRLFNESEE
ncbi:hypothetical protein Calla_2037 [Caldicellulosiruptor acetigenus 6A]|uniref:DUF1648 domain-containing protein n=1 Tax=Caldicellulosiruptor acetigenus 6A TaxID=632516 RepID=G2PVK4_9FIRM|nr:hypothetical protein Calla_2037 [Caldicellulosiruptor acetigenus 6A]